MTNYYIYKLLIFFIVIFYFYCESYFHKNALRLGIDKIIPDTFTSMLYKY